MAEQYFESMVQKLPSACVIDITPPTFAGITGLVPQANGSLLASWSAATDPTLPLVYELYCLPGVVAAAALFAASPALKTSNLSEYLFRDSVGALLIGGTYTVGVRVRDGVGNLDSNLIVMTAVSAGVLTDDLATIAASLAATEAALAADATSIDSSATSLAATEYALAADAASIAASEAALAADAASISASASTLLQAAQTFPDVNASIGVIEDDEISGTAGDDDELTLALSGGGVGFNGNEVVLYHTITLGEETAKQLTLPSLPQDVTEVKVDWISVGPQVFGTDFTVTTNVLSWAGLGMDTEGLSSGDKLRIVYLSQ